MKARIISLVLMLSLVVSCTASAASKKSATKVVTQPQKYTASQAISKMKKLGYKVKKYSSKKDKEFLGFSLAVGEKGYCWKNVKVCGIKADVLQVYTKDGFSWGTISVRSVEDKQLVLGEGVSSKLYNYLCGCKLEGYDSYYDDEDNDSAFFATSESDGKVLTWWIVSNTSWTDRVTFKTEVMSVERYNEVVESFR